MTQGRTLSIGAVVMVVMWGILVLLSGCASPVSDPYYLEATYEEDGKVVVDTVPHRSYQDCIESMWMYEVAINSRAGQQTLVVLSNSESSHIQTVYRASSNTPTQIFIRCLSGRNG